MPPRKQKSTPIPETADYQHTSDTRLNNPPAGIAGVQPIAPGRQRYAYDPHIDPQLHWTGKAEHLTFDVETVPLHIHERISPAAILDGLRTAPIQRKLFGDPELPLDQAVEFYQHEMQWVNRLILGDSLLVMNSLLERELLAGKVQCIYFDPPYGIKYGSNFQPFTSKRDVKDGADDSLTREPEQIKAFRDTWELGVHSYLTYLRDRLLLCRDLLTESGSIFVQISDENVHRVRCLLDEVFGAENFIGLITFQKTGGLISQGLVKTLDYICWYSKNFTVTKMQQLFSPRESGDTSLERYDLVQLPNGKFRSITSEERISGNLPKDAKRCRQVALESANPTFDFKFQGKLYTQRWKTNLTGLQRMSRANRILSTEKRLNSLRYVDDFPVVPITDRWVSIQIGTALHYVVQTSNTVIQRCILMTTDPGDIVFDLTCGSGTTAYVAEQWGRRWITCDTSRVALALARQRIMTATYPYYKLAQPTQGVGGAFVYKTVPHVTLKDIANNEEIDSIHARWQARMEPLRAQLNSMLNQTWEEWQLPREVGAHWTNEAKQVHGDWWDMRLLRQQEIDESISRNATQETLYDQPDIDRSIVRVAGPFTVEAVQPPIVNPDIEQPVVPAMDDSKSYLDRMIEQLKKSGITVRNQTILVNRIVALTGDVLHAECDYVLNGQPKTAAVVFGPQYGPLTIVQLEEALSAARGTYDALITAAFTYDANTHALLAKNNLKPPVLGVVINADILTNDLLKTTSASQVFSVFGKPDILLHQQGDGTTYTVEVQGVDVYDPNTREFTKSNVQDLAAWFVDTDYNGQTFFVHQAYFPVQTPNPWAKLGKALKGTINEEQIAALQRTTLLPFKAGSYKTCAVKVIDQRGNEVMMVLKLG